MLVQSVNLVLEGGDGLVLQNKLGISNSVELAREEERISKKKALDLFDTAVLEEYPVGSFAQLAAIHRYLFEDIYDFAGNLRTVNMAKGNFRFAPVMYLASALESREYATIYL